MLQRIIAVGLFCVTLLFSGAGWAARVELPLLTQEAQLKGPEAELQFQVAIDARENRRSEPRLVLRWRKSRLLDLQRSTLSIVIDGVARRSVRLVELGESGEYTVSLAGVKGGVRMISLRASLRVDEDPCLRQHRDEAWFTVKPGSVIEWERKSVLPPAPTAVRDFPDAWRPLAGKPAGVVLDFNAALDREGVGAYLDADGLLRRWAYLPQKQEMEGTVGTLRLRTMNGADEEKKLGLSPEARFAWVAEAPGVLTAYGRDTAALREALLMLADDPARAMCPEAVCRGGHQKPRPPLQPAAAAANGATPPVWRMANAGYAQGWTVRGEGQQQLRIVWRRPVGWRLQEWPMLQLQGQVSESKALDAELSAITVRINDRPVATYPLTLWRSGWAEVRIPREFWSANEWVIDLSVSLRTADERRCLSSDATDLWARLGPETALTVPHQDKTPEGVASFYRDMRLAAAPVLGLSGTPTQARLSALAAVLYPFVRADEPAVERRWNVVDARACEAQQCVRLADAPPASSPLRYEPPLWRDASGRLRMPDLGVEDTAGLFYVPPRSRGTAQLLVVAGLASSPSSSSAKADAVLEPPDYGGLVGWIALYAQGWHTLDVRAEPGASQPAAAARVAEPANASREQLRLRWMNLLWGALSVLVIGFLLVRLWRRSSRSADAGWEIHN